MANKTEKTLEQLKAKAELAAMAYETAWRAEEKKKKEAEEKKKAELATVKAKRYQEIQDAEQKLIELKNAYIKDYGSYSNTKTYDGDTAIDLLRWLLQ